MQCVFSDFSVLRLREENFVSFISFQVLDHENCSLLKSQFHPGTLSSTPTFLASLNKNEDVACDRNAAGFMCVYVLASPSLGTAFASFCIHTGNEVSDGS